jgi:hypothetical protein
MSTHKLLVEGAGDQAFFRTLLKNIGYEHVDVYPPKSVGAKGDGIDNLLTILPELLDSISSNAETKLGIVLDADYPRDQENNSHGYQARREKVIKELVVRQYVVTSMTKSPQWRGEILNHTDGLSPVGIWIMPDHFSDGMIEDFWLSCIADGVRKNLLDSHINRSITELLEDEQFKAQEILFSPTHHAKVRFETWLNWQKKPSTNDKKHECYRRLTASCAFRDGWFDPNHDNIKALTTWLTRVFQ